MTFSNRVIESETINSSNLDFSILLNASPERIAWVHIALTDLAPAINHKISSHC